MVSDHTVIFDRDSRSCFQCSSLTCAGRSTSSRPLVKTLAILGTYLRGMKSPALMLPPANSACWWYASSPCPLRGRGCRVFHDVEQGALGDVRHGCDRLRAAFSAVFRECEAQLVADELQVAEQGASVRHFAGFVVDQPYLVRGRRRYGGVQDGRFCPTGVR